MELTFIRHAQPRWVVDDKSVLDPDLTDLGRDQAERLAQRAHAWPSPTRLLVSSARRAQQTAAPLAQTVRVPAETHAWLEEMRFPAELDGVDASQVMDILQRAPERSAEEWWQGIPGGERYEAFHARVTENLDTLLKTYDLSPHGDLPVYTGPEHREVRLWFVGHGGTNSAAVGHLLGLPAVPWTWERFVLQHAGVTRLRSRPLLGGQLFGLVAHSDVAHLPRAGRSR